MRQSTRVWAKFESLGKPEDTLTINDTIYNVMMQYAQWIQETYMGTHIRMVIARTRTDLEQATAKWLRATTENPIKPDSDLMHDLQELMGQESFDLDDSPDSTPTTPTTPTNSTTQANTATQADTTNQTNQSGVEG